MRRPFLLMVLAGLVSVMAWGAAIPLADRAPTSVAADLVADFTPQPSPPPSPWPAPSAAWAPQQPAPEGSFLAAVEAARVAAADYPGPIFPLADPTQRPAWAVQPSPSPTTEPASTPRPKASPSAKKPKAKPAVQATPQPTAKPKPTPKPSPPAEDYAGTSRFWYPALGIETRWRWYGCDYGGDPSGLGAGIYRWGCNAKSNIYLMSHAWSTFKAIKRGYHSGAMKVGQPVWYANQKGVTTQWKVKWIKRVTDDYLDATHSEWATVGSDTPIMTLQTCDGAKDQYRLIVRLVRAD
jgi:hypothetical protein